ncbi:site-specific integrase [Pacificibacter marinus]|uniref:site-specific integrase n=1 Tax=Pacificibacter marinus TaxID=658057 RepID=UPI001C072CCA|nr:site-specific integrase [Pacificibacter marinus]MBU2866620.1 site-specific integrase [Pacificibacter marinus]
MPLSTYKRGEIYWAKGWIEYNSRPIAGPYRRSTRASTESGAWDWIAAETEAQINRHLFGESHARTFNDAILSYPVTQKTARQLIPIAEEIGKMPLGTITGALLLSLGPKLKPNAGTDTWWREVVTPARAVINYSHHKHGTPMIKVLRYKTKERHDQDRRRGKVGRIKRQPSDREWVEAFCRHADPYNAAMLRFMFETAARIDQAISLVPDDLDPHEPKVKLKAQKGHDQCQVTVSPEMMEELRALTPKRPRNRQTGQFFEARVFGYKTSTGYACRWRTICKQAKIPFLSAHAAGRHGYYTELVVRQGVDPVTAAKAGRWSDVALPLRIYAHDEDSEASVRAHFRT